MPKSSRHNARIIAFQTIYSRGKLGLNQNGEERILADAHLEAKYAAFCSELISKTWEHLEELDQIIQAHLKNWKQTRLADTLNALLRISVCELKFFPATESKIIFNESIEICREFVDEKATKICNGVLHSAAKDLRVEHMSEKIG